jgi:hypothetical protein
MRLHKGILEELFKFEDVPADGNCFYHSISRILVNHNAESLRSIVGSYVSEHEGIMQHLFRLIGTDDEPYQVYVEKMTSDCTWVELFRCFKRINYEEN